jgi:hypothetical protein
VFFLDRFFACRCDSGPEHFCLGGEACCWGNGFDPFVVDVELQEKTVEWTVMSFGWILSCFPHSFV